MHQYCLSHAYCPRCRRYTPHGFENEAFTTLVRQCVRCGLVVSDGISEKTGVDTGREVSKLDERTQQNLFYNAPESEVDHEKVNETCGRGGHAVNVLF